MVTYGQNRTLGHISPPVVSGSVTYLNEKCKNFLVLLHGHYAKTCNVMTKNGLECLVAISWNAAIMIKKP
jgi:hypothetical protein